MVDTTIARAGGRLLNVKMPGGTPRAAAAINPTAVIYSSQDRLFVSSVDIVVGFCVRTRLKVTNGWANLAGKQTHASNAGDTYLRLQ